jgi:DNA-binding transcriptional LysR family regulator
MQAAPCLRGEAEGPSVELADTLFIAPHKGTAVSPLDTQLQAQGLSRRIACTVATFAMGPRIVRETDHVLLMAERMARPMAHELGLRVTEPPFGVQFPITMAWHRRMTTDPAHRWLRGLVEACCE